MTSDLPYESYWKGKLYDGKNDMDKRTRGMGDVFASCGEENLLQLPRDRYYGRDICSHEFTGTIHRYGLSANVWDEIDGIFDDSNRAFLRSWKRELEVRFQQQSIYMKLIGSVVWI